MKNKYAPFEISQRKNTPVDYENFVGYNLDQREKHEALFQILKKATTDREVKTYRVAHRVT